jgi:hypothetical protein
MLVRIRHKYWNAFDGYLYVLDLINTWKMEHTKIINAHQMNSLFSSTTHAGLQISQ